MMNHFRKVYVPGGMSLRHSGWWLVQVGYDAMAGEHYHYIKQLIRSDYQ